MSKKRYQNNKILVLADVHFPFHSKSLFDFLNDVNNKEKPDRVIINGDLTDSYQFSSYSKSLSADSPVRELKNMRKEVKKLASIFPEVIITDSNHDARLWRKAKIAGIPREVLMPYIKMIGAENYDWKLVPEARFTVDADRSNWFVQHHMAGTSINASKHMVANMVLSHHHTRQGITRWCGPRADYWACDTGCLIDESGYAFAYQRLNQGKPTKGVLLIEEGQPRIIKCK